MDLTFAGSATRFTGGLIRLDALLTQVRKARHASASASLAAGFAILLLALNLRPAVVAVSPLLSDLQADTGINSPAAGLLMSLPVLCFGVFSLVAPLAARRWGIEPVLVWSLVVLCAGFALRLLPDLMSLYAGTVLVGGAAAFGNVLLPALIKRDFEARLGLMTALYSMTVAGGAALAAGLTVPIARYAHLDWRLALGAWGLLSLVALLVWTPRLRRKPVDAVLGGFSRVWGRGVAWAVTLYFGFQCLNFFAVTAWLPEYFGAQGASAVEAGWLLSLANIMCIPGAFLAALIAERLRRQSMFAVLVTALAVIGLVGVIALPDVGYLWVALLGLAQGAALGLGLTLVVLRTSSSELAADLSGMAQSIGYLIAALGPLLLGIAHELSASWVLAFGLLILLLVPQAISGYRGGRDTYVA